MTKIKELPLRKHVDWRGRGWRLGWGEGRSGYQSERNILLKFTCARGEAALAKLGAYMLF